MIFVQLVAATDVASSVDRQPSGGVMRHYPRARQRTLLLFWRKPACLCGLVWPCADSRLERVRARYAPTDRTGMWCRPSEATWPVLEHGRAGAPTPGQAARGIGGQR